ncbi:MAG: TetR/AcrR family transcriptional regulator [Flavobacteriia bacterium]|nr:TetR/AcrR family transcriptional regulator [Flavobacteriia bacterium]NBV66937.1 TetR/AcrR family transcriptional regulator [Flavobacteriia bacterium]NBY41050.1 TetR/AcrR family transcriptional regulator [Flavobacteriia bacterium]
MYSIFHQIKLPINEKLFLKDPSTTTVGQKMLDESILLINELGFEKFTFKKLAVTISSTEATIYRYFESKHKLLLYLINWYWCCISTRLLFETTNIIDPKIKLQKAIHLLTSIPNPKKENLLMNEFLLKKIVINEASKVIQTKEVDNENKDGVFTLYKNVVFTVANMINEVSPDYRFPNMLVTSMIEGSSQQHFFAEHLPRLTNAEVEKDFVEVFYQELIFKTIQNDTI